MRKEQTRSNEVTIMASTLGGTVPLPTPPTVQQLPPMVQQLTEASVMEVSDQSDRKMADGTGVQQLGSKGPTMEDADMA